MSLLSRILPHALCCFLPSRDIEQDETRPSTSHDAGPTVTRKPMPYAMINVPHQPDIADEQAFRRMLTASPACPIEAGPIGNTQLRANRKRKKELSRQKSSVDVISALGHGSPAPTSDPPNPREARERGSKPRVNKNCSKGKSRESEPDGAHENQVERVDDTTAATLAAAESTGMVDILTPRNASLADYDSDAKIIKTPDIEGTEVVTQDTSDRGARDPKDHALIPADSVSNTRPSPLSVKNHIDSTPKRLTHSSPYPCTPEKISFTAALQPKVSESPTVVLKRLSAGIADGSVRPPTDLELSTLRGSISRGTPGDFQSPLEAPLRWSSIKKDPDSPQTVIRRLSDMVQREEKRQPDTSTANEESESKRNSLLTHLDPALLGYLSRFSEMASLDLTLDDGTATPETAVRKDKHAVVECVVEDEEPTLSDEKPWDQSHTETTSMMSILPSEQNSLHLFNMEIPTRLESQSSATIFSPAVSNNNSKISLDSPPPMPYVIRNSPIRHVPPFVLGRAEHNRKPSDPQTRHLFEQPGQRYHPYWKLSTTSLAKSKTLSERDDASSIYSTEYGAPDRSEAPNLINPLTVRKHVNSLAVGGRSASTEIPVRRSSRTYSSTLQVPGRSFSSAGRGEGDRLNAATEVIGKYLDGKVEDDRSESSERATQAARRHHLPASNNRDRAVNLDIERSPTNSEEAHRFGTVRLTPDRQCSPSPHSKNQAFSDILTKPPANDDDGGLAPPSALKKSATALWNRAYREARADSQARDLLSKGKFTDAELYLSPSAKSLQFPYRSRSSSILQTPKSALRRSQSVGPDTRTSLQDDMAIGNDPGSSRFAKTMKRLSFWNLKPQRHHESLDCAPWKTQRRYGDEVTKRRSTSVFEIDRAVNLRAAHTPPLSHYLGLWGSFPSHAREERTGPASKLDNVLTRNFGVEKVRDGSDGNRAATLRSRLSTNTLSMMQSTSKKLFPGRSNKLDRNKTKSMSPGSPRHRIEKNQGVLLKRWQRQYRTKSSEWRGHMTAHGHRSSLSPGLPAEYPELEQVQGTGDFDQSPKLTRPFYKVDSASFGSVISPASDNGFADSSTKMTNAVTQTSERQPAKNKSSTWESITFANMSDEELRTKENVNLSRLSNEGMHIPVKKTSFEVGATTSRNSKDLKMPGGFEDY